LKTNNYPLNTDNISSKVYKDLNGSDVPLLEIEPLKKKINLEVILFHGASPYGEEHPAMIDLALALSNGGIKVYIPRLPKLTQLEINIETVDIIAHFYSIIKEKSPNKNIVPAGMSFGGGLLMMAMLKDNVKNILPKSILAYGTYYSLETSIGFLVSGKIKNNGNEEFVKPNDWGLVVLFHNYLSGIDVGFDSTKMQKVLKLRVNNKVSESEIEMKKLPENQIKILENIFQSNQVPEIIEMTDLIKIAYKNEIEKISPSKICNQINYKVFLMHGVNDSMVPYTESIKLHENIPDSSLFLSGLYEHREISKGNSIIEKVKELKKMSSFFIKFMDYNVN
jgi:hypothetical protein